MPLLPATTTTPLSLPPEQVASIVQAKERTLTPSPTSRRAQALGLNAILAKVAAGDRQAFAQFYDEIAGAVLGVVVRIVRSQSLAEEVAQEVFLEVWRKATNWQPERGAAATWVLMIARARAIDQVRSEQASKDRQDRVTPGWIEPASDDVAEKVTMSDEHSEVRTALTRLSDAQREVIRLAFYGGKTYVEVANHLGLPVGTVKTRMRDGLIRLRQIYGVTR